VPVVKMECPKPLSNQRGKFSWCRCVITVHAQKSCPDGTPLCERLVGTSTDTASFSRHVHTSMVAFPRHPSAQKPLGSHNSQVLILVLILGSWLSNPSIVRAAIFRPQPCLSWPSRALLWTSETHTTSYSQLPSRHVNTYRSVL
jgi:hypothetical protein